MNKSLIAIALLAATTMFTSAAEAGFKVRLGFGGPLPSFTAYGNGGGGGSYGRHCDKPSYRAERRQERAAVRLSKKSSNTTVAKVEEKVEDKADAPKITTAETENSSISSAAETVADTKKAEPVKTAEVKRSDKIDCKKFFPSVGMTLTVPCE